MNALDRSLSVSGIGLCLAGWVSLISGSMMEPGSLLIAGRSISQRDVMVLGQSALITGCMLIFAASMRNGFGALDRFFNAALERANRAAALRMGDGEAGDVMAGTRSAPVFMPTAVPVSIDGGIVCVLPTAASLSRPCLARGVLTPRAKRGSSWRCCRRMAHYRTVLLIP